MARAKAQDKHIARPLINCKANARKNHRITTRGSINEQNIKDFGDCLRNGLQLSFKNEED